ncbi:LuxR C-terminal-related transcriptional regulator [Hyphomicrobium sp. 99]|uniref:helix-turn-helix transcriptional regulator n=1 Tax=Hyphomicrobium sp. 99 TaxID=1163419 RepID=UPI0005F86478|nr:LuxR C-terminal-related transcriptional regulator [Hyphomicrobium sp. 99]
MSEVLNDANWYVRLGTAAKSAGTPAFYENMLRLFGSGISHEYGFAVRYGNPESTDVLCTTGHPDFIVDEYKTTYHHVDPFGSFWRSTRRKGLVTSQQVLNDTAESRLYTGVFQRRAKISDEIGVVFPSPGKACIALFLESSDRKFSDKLAAHIENLFPALEGLHFAHLARTFGKLCELTPGADDASTTPILLMDRKGQVIYRSASWREAEDQEPRLSNVRKDIRTIDRCDFDISETMSLKVARLPDDFSIAPEGQICVLNWRPVRVATEKLAALDNHAIAPLTKLESDVLELIKLTKSSGQIAVELGIAKGTVKNYKQRLYRKFAVNSERELLGLLAKSRV